MRCRHSKSALNLSFPYHCLQSSSIRSTTLRSMAFLLGSVGSMNSQSWKKFQVYYSDSVCCNRYEFSKCSFFSHLWKPTVKITEGYFNGKCRWFSFLVLISTHKPLFLCPFSEVTLSIYMHVMNLKCSWNAAVLPPTANFCWQRSILQYWLKQKCHSREFIAAIFCCTFDWRRLWPLRNDRTGSFRRWFLDNFCRNMRLTPRSSI